MRVAFPSPTPTAYAALSPYLIPPALSNKKRVNFGDGIILRAIERHVGAVNPEGTLSPRTSLTARDVQKLIASSGVILAGANQLNDHYTIWPGLTADQLREIPVRFIPFGIGIHGEAGHTDGLSAQSKELLSIVHERIPFSSWRCPATVEYLRKALPHLSDKFLMTGCPVLYDRPLLEGVPFADRIDRISVTVTERGDFFKRELSLLTHVAKALPRAKRFLTLHQNFSPPSSFESLRHRLGKSPVNQVEALRLEARRLGFSIFIPRSADDLIRFYKTVDAHVGSRLHAHLLCLSLAKRSALIGVDGRATGIADHFGFPLYQPETITEGLHQSFEPIRERARSTFAVMQKFLSGNFGE